MNNTWLYYGMFLDDAAKNTLIETFTDIIPEDWRIYAEHMTIIYNDGSAKAEEWRKVCEKELGTKTVLNATEIGMSDKAIAVKVNGYPTNNSIPHITIAVSPNGKPVDSNKIENWQVLNVPIPLSAVLKRVDKK